MKSYAGLKSITYKKQKINNAELTDLQNIVSVDFRHTSNSNHQAITYLWTAAVEDIESHDFRLFYGRTLDDFNVFLSDLSFYASMSEIGEGFGEEELSYLFNNFKKYPQIHIYNHNLPETFHVLRNRYDRQFNKHVFAGSKGKPLNADIKVNNSTFELHDTSKLFIGSLEEWAENYELPVKKYPEPEQNGIITPETPITANELAYSFNNSLIVAHGIRNFRRKYGLLKNMAPTQPSMVRREISTEVSRSRKDWIETCKNTIKSYTFDTYSDLGRMLWPAMHNSSMYDDVVEGVFSNDMHSAYPYFMCTQKFPVSPWEETTDTSDKDYAYYYKIKAENVKSKLINTFLPASKAETAKGCIEDNGNVLMADEITATLTDMDLEIFQKAYKADITILKTYRSKKEYLPKEIISLILKHYNDKTRLKGTGNVSKYNEAKTYLQCFYGVFVTRNITDEVYFEDGWKKILLTEDNFEQKRDDLANSKPFISYQIGTWVTAYCRYALWSIISEIDQYVVYYDTDCIKHCAPDNSIFEKYNNMVDRTITEVSAVLGIDRELFCPLGETIGKFGLEYIAEKFKTTGAKRYVAEINGETKATISGISKEAALIHIKKAEDLVETMTWTKEEAGRKLIVYNSSQGTIEWTDRDGNVYVSKEKYGVSTSKTGFRMGADDQEFERMLYLGKNYKNEKTEIFSDI